MKRFYTLVIMALSFFAACSQKGETADDFTAKKIIKKLSDGKSLIVKDKNIKGILDFTKIEKTDARLPVAAVYVESEIVFVNCTFEDSVAAFSSGQNMVRTVFNRNVTFYDCKFLKGVDFTQAEFAKDFSFESSRVEGRTAFDGADFSKGAVFASANFMDDCTFTNCRFSGRTTFYKSLFKKALIMQHIKFYEPVTFWDANFYGYFEFSDIRTLDSPDFSNAKISGRAVFSNSVFGGGLKLAGCRVENPEAFEQKNNRVIQTAEIKDIFNQ